MSSAALLVAVFLASLVEAVEATTVVLAAGATRNWRSALTGALAGVALLAIIVAALGPAILAVPINWLRLVVGGLLLVFGLQWMRKAILRASGYKALHDEAAIYESKVAAARGAQKVPRLGVSDWYAFTLSFKAVLLEGLEVVFIVLTFGANQGQIGLASIGAGAAAIVVVAIGFAVRAPLSRVPENTLKFVVGIMLTAFGTFWAAEGAGATWPGSDMMLLVLAPVIALYALVLVWLFRARRLAGSTKETTAETRDPVSVVSAPTDGGTASAADTAAVPPGVGAAESHPAAATVRPSGSALWRGIRGFGLFLWDFLVGDDWTVAFGVIVGLWGTFVLSVSTLASAAWVVVPLEVCFLLPWGIWRALK